MDEMRVIENAKAFVKELFSSEFSGHDHFHTFRVLAAADKLAMEEGADMFTVRLAALLHDVDDVKLSPETADDLGRARAFMAEQGVDPDAAERVCAVIKQISFKGTDSVVPDSLEGMVVQDADRLDAIGAIGIARCFAFGGSRKRPLYDPEVPPVSDMNEAQYRNSNSSSLNHFYEKLFLLKDMMNTPSAKRMAEERDSFMHFFTNEFLAEWKGER